MSDSPQYTPVPPHAAQAGLNNNTAGALAYITIIPAIIFLLVEPYKSSSYVRFHAWQCIFLHLAAVILETVLVAIPVIGWILLPFVGLGILILAIYAIIKALGGVRYEIPLIGKYAAKTAGA
jgi:uncharacterized membrane protein